MVERRDARARHHVISIGQRLPVVRGRCTGRHVPLEIVGVVVAPAIHSRRQRQREPGCRSNEVLNEETEALLRSPRDTLERDLGSGQRIEAVLFTVAIDPAPVEPRGKELSGADSLRPFGHPADTRRRHGLIERHAADAAWRSGDRHREEVAMKPREVGVNADLQIAVIGHPDSHAAIYRRPGRIVGFLRSVDGAVLRVLSLLVEVSGAHEGVDPRRELGTAA